MMPERSQITSFALDVIAGLLIFALSWAKADKYLGKNRPSVLRTMIISVSFGAMVGVIAYEYFESCRYGWGAAMAGVFVAPKAMRVMDGILDYILAAAAIKIAASAGTTSEKLRERVEAMRNETGGGN